MDERMRRSWLLRMSCMDCVCLHFFIREHDLLFKWSRGHVYSAHVFGCLVHIRLLVISWFFCWIWNLQCFFLQLFLSLIQFVWRFLQFYFENLRWLKKIMIRKIMSYYCCVSLSESPCLCSDCHLKYIYWLGCKTRWFHNLLWYLILSKKESLH